jgi:hypothetical protein
MNKNGMAAYKSALETQVLEGLVTGDLGVLQPGRGGPSGASDGNKLCECAINPTHCYRTVSQRSLSVPTRFLSQQRVIPAGNNFFADLFNSAAGAFGTTLTANGPGVIFNDANVNTERRRIYDMVMIALRASINVKMSDATAVAAGAIDVSSLQTQIEEFAAEYIGFKIYHSADRADPWVDTTQLKYILRPNGGDQGPGGPYLLVPPVKWIDRDPAMELVMVGAEKGGAAGSEPWLESNVRDFDGTASITIDALFVPDPDVCPDLWPGKLCPKENIANTPYYTGKIQSAKRALKSLVK